mmetsp:Transcript_3413/g.8863  ORF Transcript_3413/g.8863 Transcript_3413/m.8863 type:complete len:216 (+) Transcript_3413:298-945(+)
MSQSMSPSTPLSCANAGRPLLSSCACAHDSEGPSGRLRCAGLGAHGASLLRCLWNSSSGGVRSLECSADDGESAASVCPPQALGSHENELQLAASSAHATRGSVAARMLTSSGRETLSMAGEAPSREARRARSCGLSMAPFTISRRPPTRSVTGETAGAACAHARCAEEGEEVAASSRVDGDGKRSWISRRVGERPELGASEGEPQEEAAGNSNA